MMGEGGVVVCMVERCCRNSKRCTRKNVEMKEGRRGGEGEEEVK
jgi:hypothetical protein